MNNWMKLACGIALGAALTGCAAQRAAIDAKAHPPVMPAEDADAKKVDAPATAPAKKNVKASKAVAPSQSQDAKTETAEPTQPNEAIPETVSSGSKETKAEATPAQPESSAANSTSDEGTTTFEPDDGSVDAAATSEPAQPGSVEAEKIIAPAQSGSVGVNKSK